MWNSLITPQPNKHIRIIMPKQYIPKGTEIIVGDENWYLVDYDVVSVPEIIFMSFTEGKYNELRDDISRKKFGKLFADLDEDQQKAVQQIYPQKISEAEPKNYGDKK